MQAYKFNGKKYKVSERKSADVKVGDVVKIVFPDGCSEWDKPAMAMVDRLYVVTEASFVGGDMSVKTSGSINYRFWKGEFQIMEEDKSRNHPHADMIRQWLNDASLEVEYRSNSSEPWSRSGNPMWEPTWQYRFKPKTVPAWKVLYELDGDIDMSIGHYATEQEFNIRANSGKKFIKFVLETEKQFSV